MLPVSMETACPPLLMLPPPPPPLAGSIYTFNVATERPTHELAETLGVRIVSTNIIYRLVEQLKEEITAQLPPLPKEVIVGK